MQRTSLIALIVAGSVTLTGGGLAQQPAQQPAQAAAPAASVPAPGGLSQAKQPAPNLSALQANVQTVGELIKVENELALQKAKKERIQGGLEQEAQAVSAKAKGPARLMVEVESIAGVDGRLRAYLTGNGQRYENVGVGARVQSCQVEAIVNGCVVLRPAASNVKAEQCPQACWTGVRPQPAMALIPGAMHGVQGSLPMPGGPLPLPTAAVVQPRPMTPQAGPTVSPSQPLQQLAVPSQAMGTAARAQ